MALHSTSLSALDLHAIDSIVLTRALLRLERTMNLLEGGKGGWGREGGEGTEGGWGREGGEGTWGREGGCGREGGWGGEVGEGGWGEVGELVSKLVVHSSIIEALS